MSSFEWHSKFDKEPPLNKTIVVQNLYGGDKPYVYCKRTKDNTYKSIDGTPKKDFDFEFWSLYKNDRNHQEVKQKLADLWKVDVNTLNF